MLKDDWNDLKRAFNRREYRIVKKFGHTRMWYYVAYKRTWWPWWTEADFFASEREAQNYVDYLIRKRKKIGTKVVAHRVDE